MLQIWLRAINPGLTPSKAVATYEEILQDEPNPTLGKGLLWILISAVIAAIINGLLSLVVGVIQGVPIEFVLAGLVSMLLFIPVVQVIIFLINSIILFALSRIEGGEGTLGRQAYVVASAQAPLGVVIAIIGVIPGVVGSVIVLLAIIYGLWLLIMALRAAHGYSTWKALVTVLFPIIILTVCTVCLLALIGPAVGNVFNNIIEDIEREGATEIVPLSVSSEHFLGDDFSLDYPGGWELIDQSENPFCQQPGVDCLFSAGNLSGDGAEISIIRFEFIADMSIEDADEMMWSDFIANTPGVTLIEHQSFFIDDVPSALRVFSFPGVDPESLVYLFQASTLKDDALYQVTGYADTSETFDTHIPTFEDVVESIELAR